MRLLLTLIWLAAALHAVEFKIGTHTFTLPEGFEIEAVAAPPLVDRPVNMAFDEAGALYVTDSSGSNERPDLQVKNPTHRVLKLTDSNGDGRFDKRTVYADKLAFPEGTMWLAGSLYVSAPPKIWKFTDADGDGVAEKREVWFDGRTLTDCANDLHGPYFAPDGFVYWCKGAFAEQRHRLANGKEFVSRASHVFRMRPDGSGFDVVMTGGMDNPVDIVFSAAGERFVSGTFFEHPHEGRRDGILHAVHGGVWGKDHDVLRDHPRTGALMPVMQHLGPAAPSGLELLRGGALAMEGSLLACEFNMRRVSRHVLVPKSATFAPSESDLVVSNNRDFHPTDVIEDADGTVLIADTGGWYKLCCPTSQLAKPEVLGAIYRLKKSGAKLPDDPRGLGIAWKDATDDSLVRLLGDGRQAVADRAADALARANAIPALARAVAPGAADAKKRLRVLWVLARIENEEARELTRRALADADAQMRLAACNSAALWRDAGATNPLLALLADGEANVRRAALAALGRIGDRRVVPALAALDVSKGGRFLEHAAAYALFEIGDEQALAAVERRAPHAETALRMIREERARKPSPPLRPIPIVAAPQPDRETLSRQRARLDELEALPPGDAKRGREIFRSEKSACQTCHAIGAEGGTFGPDLTKVGAIRGVRDLLEAVVFPAASHVRSYEPVIVKAKDGEHAGIVIKDAAEEIVLASGPGANVRIARDDVIEIRESPVSLMPAGFDGILTPGEIADLVAFLQQAK